MIHITFKPDQTLASQVRAHLKDSSDRDLDLSSNRLGKRSQNEIIEMIKELKHLKVTAVNMANNGLHLLSSADLVAIITTFEETEVTSLDLSSNLIGTKPAGELEEIAASFQKTSIRTLDLSSSNFGNQKIADLKTFLTKLNSSRLELVNLSFNQFDRASGAHKVAELCFSCLPGKVVITATDAFTRILVDHLQKLLQASGINSTDNASSFFYKPGESMEKTLEKKDSPKLNA